MCCGSNNYTDWKDSVWIQRADNARLVPDSCCKTPDDLCGIRDHPSNIYNVEVRRPVYLVLIIGSIGKKKKNHFIFTFSHIQGGCIMKLESFTLSQLYILGAVGTGIAFLQVKLEGLMNDSFILVNRVLLHTNIL